MTRHPFASRQAIPKLDGCPACGWAFAASADAGCVPGNCSMRSAEAPCPAPSPSSSAASEAPRPSSPSERAIAIAQLASAFAVLDSHPHAAVMLPSDEWYSAENAAAILELGGTATEHLDGRMRYGVKFANVEVWMLSAEPGSEVEP